MTDRRIATLIGIGVVVVVAMFFAGAIGIKVWTKTHPCDVPDLPIYDGRSLACHPETHLSYPGSTLVLTGSDGEQHNGFEQPASATYDSYWGLDHATQDQVATWFGSQMSAGGWSSVGPYAAASLDWSRGRENFVLFFLDSNSFIVTSDPALRAFSLPYQTRYYITPFGPTTWLP